MPFNLPQFNILCDIYSADQATGRLDHAAGPRIDDEPCQLRFWAGGSVGNGSSATSLTVMPLLLIAALTDVRSTLHGVNYRPDYIEVPAGSDRWYRVHEVDDIAKGFANEYRQVIIYQTVPVDTAGVSHYWPIPIP